jgi:hypothetical protein
MMVPLCVVSCRGAHAQAPAPDARTIQGELAELRTRVAALEALVERLVAAAGHDARAEAAPSAPPPSPPRVAPQGELPPAVQVPGYPWLRVEEGVLYFQPVPVAPDLVRVLGSPGGLDAFLAGVQTRWVGERLRVTALPAGHLLSRHLGVRVGDHLLSINELPFPRTDAERDAMRQALSGCSRFGLAYRRGEQRIVAAFYVAETPRPPRPAAPVAPPPEQVYRLVVASQDSERPRRNSVVLQHLHGRQSTLFVGDTLDGYVVESIRIEREGERTRATLVLAAGDERRTLRLVRDTP